MISSKLTPPGPRAEVLAAAGIAEVQVARQDSVLAVQPDDCVLHVFVEDPVGEVADEAGRVHSLPDQRRWTKKAVVMLKPRKQK